MTLQACAELVERGDPDRFKTAQLAPADIQNILWPLYAFNIEVSRAPWVTQESMIAEIRLQWWRDALAEIREGTQVRAHAVTSPLAEVLDAEGAMVLDRLVEARAWDIYDDPFPSRAAFDAYIDATYGHLFWTAARLIAPETPEQPIRDYAYVCGLAAMLRARAQLTAVGKQALPDDSFAAFRELAEEGLDRLAELSRMRGDIPKTLEPLMLSGFRSRPTFRTIQRDAETVFAQGYTMSEAAARLRLAKLSFLGWWR